MKEFKCYRIMEPLFHKRLPMPEKCQRMCPWNGDTKEIPIKDTNNDVDFYEVSPVHQNEKPVENKPHF